MRMYAHNKLASLKSPDPHDSELAVNFWDQQLLERIHEFVK